MLVLRKARVVFELAECTRLDLHAHQTVAYITFCKWHLLAAYTHNTLGQVVLIQVVELH